MRFYLTKVDELDDVTGKTVKRQYLIEAESTHEAEVNFNKYMSNTICDFEVVSIQKTPIESVVRVADLTKVSTTTV
jgi:hypothetical protein